MTGLVAMRTQSLFHFTKKLDTLFSILENGFWPQYSFEDIHWVSDTDFYGNAMVCFCDISLSKLDKHTAFYGRYGIGMKRDWGIKKGLNPLLYISEKSLLSTSLKGLFSNPNEHRNTKFYVMTSLAFTKPLKGKMKVGNEVLEKDFYEECEWRYVDTSHGGILHDEANVKGIERNNQLCRSNALEFKPGDIRYLLVESESDLTKLVDFIYTKMSHFSADDLKLLTTKIILLKDLKEDI